MILLGLLVGLLTIFCAGYGLVMLMLSAPSRFNALECSCLAWLFGTGIVSLLLWLLSLWMSGLILQAAVTASCAALGVAGWRAAAHSKLRFPLPRAVNLAEWLLLAVVAVEIVTILLVAFKYPLGWDGLLNWEIKARYGFLNGGVIPAAYYTDVSRAFSHPDYPLYLPMVELWLYLWMGEPHQFWIKIIFPTFYAVGAILLATTSMQLTGKRWAGLLAAALLFFVPFVTTTGYGGVLHGYADFPLGVFYLATMGCLLRSLHSGDANDLRLYAFALALLPWVKREGAFLWAVAALCGAIVIWQQKRSWRWLLCLAPGLFVLVLWQIFLTSMHALRPQEFVPLSLSVLQTNAARALPILQGLSSEVTNLHRWSLFWLLVLAAFVYLFVRARSLRLVVLFIAVFLPIAAYCGTYLFSSWSDYYAHIGTSLPRLLLQVVPVAWLAVAIALPPPATGATPRRTGQV